MSQDPTILTVGARIACGVCGAQAVITHISNTAVLTCCGEPVTRA